jgi:hypothetical protein
MVISGRASSDMRIRSLRESDVTIRARQVPHCFTALKQQCLESDWSRAEQ